MFTAQQGDEVVAVDIRTEVIERIGPQLANSKARAHQAIVGDANPLPLEDRSASCVLAMEVLEHGDDPAPFLSELVRIGKPDARYLVTIPDSVAERTFSSKSRRQANGKNRTTFVYLTGRSWIRSFRQPG